MANQFIVRVNSKADGAVTNTQYDAKPAADVAALVTSVIKADTAGKSELLSLQIIPQRIVAAIAQQAAQKK